MFVAYMLISTRQGKLKLVSTSLRKLEQIKELHEVYGRFDIVARVEFEEYHQVKEFIQNKIQIIEGVTKSETLLVNDLEDIAPENLPQDHAE